MKITPIRTHKIEAQDTDLLTILDQYLPVVIPENSIVAITSKIVSICEGRLLPINSVDKNELIKQEADFYLPRSMSKYNFLLTIKYGLLIPSAGIDESNSNGFYVLWPSNPQKSANLIREHLGKTRNLKNLGIVITDSRSMPLRWGVTGAGLSYSGFSALNDLRGTHDIFGRELKVTQVNVMDAIASAAVFEMGEGSEQTPLAIVSDLKNVDFQNRNPTYEELNALHIEIDDDLYAPLLKSVNWKKGES